MKIYKFYLIECFSVIIMRKESIIFLSGGTGTPKLLLGFNKSDNITVIANTADDWEYFGAYVSPDVDSVIYSLSGMINIDRFWGIKGDSFNVINQLKKLEENIWFNLGDRDFAIALYRKKLLNKGFNLTQITQKLVKILECKFNVLPMSNESISTYLKTKEHSWLHFQEYWVKFKGELYPEEIEFRGINKAKVTDEIKEKISEADKIVIGPSNPLTSIEPILSIPTMKKMIRESEANKIVVSPFINDVPLSGPAKTFLVSRGFQNISLQTIINYYEDIADKIIFDSSDESQNIDSKGIELKFTNIILDTEEKRKNLATYIKNI